MNEPNRIQSEIAEALAITHDRVGVTPLADEHVRLDVTDFGAPAPGGAGYGTADRTFTFTLDPAGRWVR